MSTQIDWGEAPEGATHYYPPTEEWYLAEHGCVPLVWTGMWCKAFQFAQREPICINRPATPSWSGEGRPPVGTPVEWFSPVYGWLGGKVVGHDGAVTVIAHNDGYTGCHPHEVRLIRTPEQIAADERESAIKEIGNMIASVGPTFRDQAIRLYDAGYRKKSTCDPVGYDD